MSIKVKDDIIFSISQIRFYRALITRKEEKLNKN